MLVPNYVIVRYSASDDKCTVKMECRDCANSVYISPGITTKNILREDVRLLAKNCGVRGCEFKRQQKDPSHIVDSLWRLAEGVVARATMIQPSKKRGWHRGREANAIMLKSLAKDLDEFTKMVCACHDIYLKGRGAVQTISKAIDDDKHPESPLGIIDIAIDLLGYYTKALTQLKEKIYGGTSFNDTDEADEQGDAKERNRVRATRGRSR